MVLLENTVFAIPLQHFNNLGRFQTATEIAKILYFKKSGNEE